MLAKVSICLLALIAVIKADGWGDQASAAGGASSSSSAGAPAPAPAEPIAGGLTPQDLSDPKTREKYTSLALVGLQEVNGQSNALYRQQLVRVTKVYTQVVSGVMYHITFTTGQSSCRKTPENLAATQDTCPLTNDPNGLYQECTVKIWAQPWRHFQKVTDQTCKKADLSVLTATSGALTFAIKEVSLEWVRLWQIEKVHEHSALNLNHDSMETGLWVLIFSSRKSREASTVGGTWPAFQTFVQTYKKTYANETEMKRRYQTFKDNMKLIKLLQEYEQGTATYGPTIFADWTVDEFSQLLIPKWRGAAKEERAADAPLEEVPGAWDWRTKNVVTPIKSQGWCLSCWAFAAVANIEGAWAVQKKTNLTSFSEQELIDCNKYGEGCFGGSTWRAYKTVMQSGGLATEQAYPYHPSVKHHACKLNRTRGMRAYINGSIALPRNESQIAQYLYKNGPVAAGINVLPLMFYRGGVARPIPFLCHPKFVNHAVTIVGYGKDDPVTPYWIIKNSFGTWWGESGYLRLFRGEGVCGIDREATSVQID